MTINDIHSVQREATRVAEIMYLLTILTASFADFYVRRQLLLPAIRSQRLRTIAASRLMVVSESAVILLISAYPTITAPIRVDSRPS
jgi:hypothetical protein